MSKTSKMLTLSLVFMLAIAYAAPLAMAESSSEPADVQLTDKQKRELASQYKEILKREQKLIATYVKYGVLTKEQGEKINAHLENRYKKLEQHGFVPKMKHYGKDHDKHHKHHHKHHHHGHDQKHHDHQHQQRQQTAE